MEGAKAGDLILVEGRTNTRSWETEDGEKKYSTEVNVSKLTLLIEKTFQADPDEEQPQQQEPSVKRTEIKKSAPQEEISIEDIPF
jgi:single-stranded DNA-binding protein